MSTIGQSTFFDLNQRAGLPEARLLVHPQKLDKDVIVSGPAMDRYMSIAELEARRFSLALRDAALRMHFLKPPVKPEGDIARLDRISFRQICFAVSDITLIAKATAAGVRDEPMVFHDRKLAFLPEPEGVTVELAEWK